MSTLTPSLCEDYVRRMMVAISTFRATGNGAEIEEGINRLDAYRCAWRGERAEEEKIVAATRALERISEWAGCLASPVPSEPSQSGECAQPT